MSIDRDVNSVVEAYRGNDYALQERYAIDKRLIDLLALQKLKSEREAATKEIQMKEQVPHTTVVDQLKQQIVGGMPQEGILAAAQGGMVRGFAEGGEIDLNEAVQTLPFDATVDVDPDKLSQTLPFDATVDVDPDKLEKLLGSSTVRQKIINKYDFDPVDVAEEVGLDPELLLKVIEAESGGNQDSVSGAGAVGLMQLMPGTARDLGVDPNDPMQNVRGGARYLRQQLDEFGDIPTALAAYNAGPGLVRNHGIPDYKETRDYINRILGKNVAVATNEEAVDADPDEMEKLLDSSSEEGTVENPDTGEQLTKIGGAIADWAYDNPMDALSLGLTFLPGIGWGALAGIRGLGLAYKALKGIDYLRTSKNIGQGIVKGSQGLGRLAQKGFTIPKTRIPKGQAGAGQFVKGGSRAFSLGRTAVVGGPLTGWALRSIGDLYENGFSDEDIEEAIASGQLTQVSGTDTDTSTGATGTGTGTDTDTSTGATGATGTGATGTGATGTGATGTGATTESPRRSAYDKLMEDYGATYKDQIANLNKEDRIKRREDRLARLAEISKPEERSFLDMASDFLAGAAASGIGGGGDALRQAEIASRKRKKDYQTMLVENEEKIDDLAQTLDDQEMAIKLTAATSEYARDIARQAMLLDRGEKRDKLVADALLKIAEMQANMLNLNFTYKQAQQNGDLKQVREIESSVRQTVNDLEEIKMLRNLTGLKEFGSSSGASSSRLVYGTPYVPIK